MVIFAYLFVCFVVSHFLNHKSVEGYLKAKVWGNLLTSSVFQGHRAQVKSNIVSNNLNEEEVCWVDEGTEFLQVGCPGTKRVGRETEN